MQASKIKVGDDYAIDIGSGRWNQHRIRGRVLEVTPPAKYTYSREYSVKFEYLDGDTGESRPYMDHQTGISSPRHVLEPWAEYKAEYDRLQAEKRATHAAENANEERVLRALRALGFPMTTMRGVAIKTNVQASMTTVTIHLDVLEEVTGAPA